MFNRFLASLIFIVLGQFSTAFTLDGSLIKLNNKIYLRDAKNIRYELKVLTEPLEIVLKRLKTKDFMSLDGHFINNNTVFEVRSVNYVGLQNIIGKWKELEGFCYHFENFKSLKIYRMTAVKTCLFTDTFLNRTMSYTINPASENWLMLLSDSKESFILDIVLKHKESVSLVLYDPETALVIRNIGLERIQ